MKNFNTCTNSPLFDANFNTIPRIVIESPNGFLSYHDKTEVVPDGYLSGYEKHEANASFLAQSFSTGRAVGTGEEYVWPFDITDFVIEEYVAPSIESCIPF